MSKTDNNQLEIIEEQKFWKDRRAVNVFNLFVQGKDIASIAEVLAMKPTTVEIMVVNKHFMTKLETFIRGLLFNNQVAKVIASAEIFTKLWERTTENMEDIPPEICLKELTKLFPTKKEGMIINPKNMNVFMKVMKGEVPDGYPGLKESLGELDDMGFEGLKENSDSDYPELEEAKEIDGDKQRDPGLDSTKSSEDKQGPTN